MTSPSQGLPRSSRVLRRADFERAYDSGRRLHGRFMTLFVADSPHGTARLGVAASRKLGPATVRNRAKRLARELFRRHRIAAGVDIIVVPRREMVHAPFSSLEADYRSLLARRHSGRPAGPRPARPHRRGRGSAPAARV